MLAVLPINSIGTSVSNKVPIETLTKVLSIPERKTRIPKILKGIRLESNIDKNASVEMMPIKKMKTLMRPNEVIKSLPTFIFEMNLPKSSGPTSIELAMAVVIRPYSTSLARIISKTIYKTPTPNKADKEKLMMTPTLIINLIILVFLTMLMPSFKSLTKLFISNLTGFLFSLGMSMVISLNAEITKLIALTMSNI